MPYVIHETTKMPARQSYNGAACLTADVTGGQIYNDKRAAQKDASKLAENTPGRFTVSRQPDSEPLPFDLTQAGA